MMGWHLVLGGEVGPCNILECTSTEFVSGVLVPEFTASGKLGFDTSTGPYTYGL